MKDFNNYNFGVIASTLYALNEQKKKKDGIGTIQAMATYYLQNAEQAVNGSKKERADAVGFFLGALYNIAANLYNNGIDIEDYRRVCDDFSDRWEGKTQE